MKQQDKIRIQHMIDAAEEAIYFVSGIDEEDFTNNRLIILSIIKEIEIIGEAASKVSKETKDELYDIPWIDIVGMRNRLIHGYFDINVQLVWNTVKRNLPPLISSLKQAII